jgi:hypothetical protein
MIKEENARVERITMLSFINFRMSEYSVYNTTKYRSQQIRNYDKPHSCQQESADQNYFLKMKYTARIRNTNPIT